MDLHLNAVTLAVLDLDRSSQFYREVLGLAEQPLAPAVRLFEVGSVRLLLRTRDALLAETGTKAGGSPRARDVFPGFTLTHYVWAEGDVDRLLADVAARGGRVVRFPQLTGAGRYAGHFADVDGYLWEVAYDPALPPT